jgi:hypothetical protein
MVHSCPPLTRERARFENDIVVIISFAPFSKSLSLFNLLVQNEDETRLFSVD